MAQSAPQQVVSTVFAVIDEANQERKENTIWYTPSTIVKSISGD